MGNNDHAGLNLHSTHIWTYAALSDVIQDDVLSLAAATMVRKPVCRRHDYASGEVGRPSSRCNFQDGARMVAIVVIAFFCSFSC